MAHQHRLKSVSHIISAPSSQRPGSADAAPIRPSLPLHSQPWWTIHRLQMRTMIQKSSFDCLSQSGRSVRPHQPGPVVTRPGGSGPSQGWKRLLRDAFSVTFGETFMTETNRNSPNKDGRRQSSARPGIKAPSSLAEGQQR